MQGQRKVNKKSTSRLKFEIKPTLSATYKFNRMLNLRELTIVLNFINFFPSFFFILLYAAFIGTL